MTHRNHRQNRPNRRNHRQNNNRRINRTYPTTATAEIINRTGPAWETDEEITPKDPKSYIGLIFARDWQTHLPPSPEGQMLASADYCTESGDIAHFILDPKSREIIIACFEQPMEELLLIS